MGQRRSRCVPDVPSQMYRDLHHEETRKREPLRGLKPGMLGWALHRGFVSHFTVIRIQLTVFSSHGNFSSWEARNSVPPWTGTPTLAATV